MPIHRTMSVINALLEGREIIIDGRTILMGDDHNIGFKMTNLMNGDIHIVGDLTISQLDKMIAKYGLEWVPEK